VVSQATIGEAIRDAHAAGHAGEAEVAS
jgi:hypothetical protein